MRLRVLGLITAVVFFVSAGNVYAKKGVPTSGGEANPQTESLQGKNSIESVLTEEENIRNTEEELERQLQEDVAKEGAEKFARYKRIKDEMEREEVLGVQNLWSRKNLTRKQKRKLRSIYRPMPATVEEYNEMSKDIKRAERKEAKPLVVKDPKLVNIDEPRFIIEKYNNPPGTVNIDLRNLKTTREVNSAGVISPNKDKLAYTAVYYENYSDKVSAEAFILPLDVSVSLKKAVQSASLVNTEKVKLAQTGMEEDYSTLFKTLTVLDWSRDGKKVAYKERIGSSYHGIWQTNLIVFNTETGKAKKLVEVRDAVIYHWKNKENIDIDDYRWDIMPLGWDELNDDRLIVSAYAFPKENKGLKFLGLFSVDADGKNSQLISEMPMSVEIAGNGLVLKQAPMEP